MNRFLVLILFVFSAGFSQLSGQSLNSIWLCDLDDEISETSGLVWVNDSLWTHNDSDNEAKLYCIDTISGNIIGEKQIINATNQDWEAISADTDFIYIGDFGNNNGNRTDLCIYKLDKTQFSESNTLEADTINFYYPNQSSFDWETYEHNFDCEAMIATGDSLYLFSKNWENEKTYLYSLPKINGTYAANLKDSLDIESLVTDAAYHPETGEILLLAYSSNLSASYLHLLKNYTENNFFESIHMQINLSLVMYQTEGLCYLNGKKFLFSNETFYNVDAGLRRADLNDLINVIDEISAKTNPIFYPNPTKTSIKFQGCARFKTLKIYDINGALVYEKPITTDSFFLQTQCLKAGTYHIEYESQFERFTDILIIGY
ncbi:MAG: T9SS type A sorting domain-containing protein [Bacteroidota bacterium]|nr:T9SS type A sorting domain-containing protein [Bacteroidota bacterium]